MFRTLLVIAGVALLFGGVLYASGDYLNAWESPKAASPSQAHSARAPRKAAKTKAKPARVVRRRSQPRRVTRKPAWLVQLNALCRSAQDEVAAIPTPITPAGNVDYIRQLTHVSKRWNRRAGALLQRGSGPDPQSVRRLLRLFEQEDTLIKAVLTAAERRQVERLGRLAPALIAAGKAENHILARLGASDCTLSEDAFRL